MDDDFLGGSARSDSQADLGDTLRKLTHRTKSILASYWWILLIGVGCGLAINYTRLSKMRDSWESGAELIILGGIDVPEADRMREVATNFHDNQLHLMTGQWVRERAAERVRALFPEIQTGWVSLGAGRKGSTDIFQLTARGEYASYTQEYLRQVIQAYLEFRRQARLDSSDDMVLSLGEELRELDARIQHSQNAIRSFQQQNNTIAIKTMSEGATNRLSELKTRLEDFHTQLRILESFDENASLDQIQDVVNLETLESTQNYRQTKRQFQQLLAMQQQFSVYLKPRHPKMMDIASELEILENRIGIFRDQAFAQLEEQKRALRNRIRTLLPEIEKWRADVVEYNVLMADYENLTLELNRMLSTREGLIQRRERLDIGRTVDTDVITVLKPPSPSFLVKVNKRKVMTEGGALGLAGAGALVLLLATLNNRISSADDIRRLLNVKVIGLIPHSKAEVSILKKDASDVFAEGFRSLRSSLLLHRQDAETPRQVFLITSSAPGEGKSTVSSNIAVTLAYSGARTLLIDCDLRRGHLHKRFGVGKEPGLAELLENRELSIHEVMMVGEDEYANLNVICAGHSSENPGDLFLGSRMDEIISSCREHYDFIILDTAPILAVDDTIGLLRKADDILFVTKSGQTSLRQIKMALERLKVSKTNIWGFILNYVSASGADYYYYSRYKSYRYHEKQDKSEAPKGPRKLSPKAPP